MEQRFKIHPVNPQARLISKVVARLKAGEIMAYPTDACYALGCIAGDKKAMERILTLRGLDSHHDFSLICPDLSSLSHYAQVDNTQFRLLKRATPGPYTFILPATKAQLRGLKLDKKTTIGLRVPDNTLVQSLLTELQSPIVSVTLQLQHDKYPLSDPDTIFDRLNKQVDFMIDGGPGTLEPTSIIDLTTTPPDIIRRGLGDVSLFEP